jgi:hypothetical protein
MRYCASDKTQIIRLVEQSPWPARRTLEKLGIPRSNQRGGPEALADRPSRPDRVWNRIPEAIRSQIVDLALDQPELSPRELAVRFTDEQEYFVSEASVYRLLKAHNLITSPAYIVIKAAEAFKDKTTAPTRHCELLARSFPSGRICPAIIDALQAMKSRNLHTQLSLFSKKSDAPREGVGSIRLCVL